MYPHSFLWHYLWLAPHALQVVLAAILIRRKLHREFPVFLLYTIFQILLNAVLFILDHDDSVSWYTYRYAEWIGDVLSIGLRFALIEEIFSVVLHSYPVLKQLGKTLLRWAILGLVVAAVAIAIYNPAVDYGSHIIAGLTMLNRAIAMIQCGLLLLLFLFSSYLGLSWRSYVFGIATGLGIFSATQLAIAAVQAQSGLGDRFLADFVPMGIYHVCVLVWLFYLLAPEPVPLAVSPVPECDFESWNRELRRLVQR